RHGRGIGVTNAPVLPASVLILGLDEFLADGGPPLGPGVAPREVHGLNAVVVPVKIVRLDAGGPAGHGLLHEIRDAAVDRIVLVDAGIEEARDAGARARPAGGPGLELVLEAAVGVLAPADVVHRAIDGLLRNLDPRVARRAQTHDLADRHR